MAQEANKGNETLPQEETTPKESPPQTEEVELDPLTVYPNFVERLRPTEPDPTAAFMRDVFLRPGGTAIAELNDVGEEERLAAYRGLSSIRAKRPRFTEKEKKQAKKYLFTDTQLMAGAVFDLWDDVEKTVEKYSSFDFPDAPAELFEDAPEGIIRDLSYYLPLILAGGVTSTVAKSLGSTAAGILNSLGPAGRLTHTMTALPAKLLFGGTGRVLVLSDAVLKEGRQDEAPELQYGITSMVGKSMGIGETEEEKEERKEKYKYMWYGGRLASHYKSVALDDLALYGIGKTLVGLKRGTQAWFKGNSIITSKGVKKADTILGGKHDDWLAEHGDATRMSMEESENFVAKAGSAQFLSAPNKIVTKHLEVGGKKVAVSYKKLADVTLPTPPPIPEEALVKKGGDLLSGSSPRRVGARIREEAAKLEGDGSLEKIDELRSLFDDEMTRAGQRGPLRDTITDNVERAGLHTMSNMVDKLIKEGSTANLDYYTQVLARVGNLAESTLSSPGVAARHATHSGVELQRIDLFKDLWSRMHKMHLTPTELRNLPPEHLDFLSDLYKGLAKGTIDPKDVALRTGDGGVRGLFHWWGRQIAHDRLGSRALMSTLTSNTVGTVDEVIKASSFYGMDTAIKDAVGGSMQVARLIGGSLSHPLEATKNLYLRITGQAVNSSLAARTLIEDALPQSFFAKFGNAITGWRFEAIHNIDEVTKAFNANGQARRAVGWLTDHRLKEKGLTNVTEEIFQKEYRASLADIVQGLKSGKENTGYMPLFYHLMEEGTSKLAFRRMLNNNAMTPIASKYHKGLFELTEKLARSEGDSLPAVAGKWFAKSLLVPFSKTALNISERSLYGVQGAIGKGKGLGAFASKDQKLVAQSMAAGMLYYLSDQLYSTGALSMAAPLASTDEAAKARNLTGNGIPIGHVNIRGRSTDASALNMVGQGMVIAHHIHAFVNTFSEDYPDEAARWLNPVMAFINTLGAGEVIRGASEVADLIHYDTQGTQSSAWQSIKTKIIDPTIESSFPLSKLRKNIREQKVGAKLAGRGDELTVSETKQKEALDILKTSYSWLRTRLYNAYGIDGFVQRDYFGDTINTIHPEEFGGDEEGFTSHIERYLLGGMGTVTKEGIAFQQQMADMGLYSTTSKKIHMGEDQAINYDAPTSKLVPPSRHLSVPVRYDIPGGRTGIVQQAIKLPIHEFNRMKGLMGLHRDVWDRHLNTLGAKDRNAVNRLLIKMLRDASYYGHKKGETLSDTIKRLAMWNKKNMRNAPRKLRHWMAVTVDDPRYGGNETLYIKPGLTLEDQLFNVAKRRAIIDMYNMMKEGSKLIMSISPQVIKQGQTLHDAVGRNDERTSIR